MIKKFIVLLAMASCSIASKAQRIKLYVGDAEAQSFYGTNILSQLVICNNTFDTVFIQKTDVDNIYPQLTNDVSEIMDGGSRILVTDIDNLEKDYKVIANIIQKPADQEIQKKQIKNNEFLKKNDGLETKDIQGQKYYVLAPSKCVTVNSIAHTADQELGKLYKLNKEEIERMKTYITMPIKYFTNREKSIKKHLMISRSSDAVKKEILLFNKPKGQ